MTLGVVFGSVWATLTVVVVVVALWTLELQTVVVVVVVGVTHVEDVVVSTGGTIGA